MAEIQTDTVSFGSNGDSADGYFAHPTGDGPFPGLIVIQEWWGIESHVKEVVERFAREGFAALAPDLYHGKVVDEPNEAMKEMMALNKGAALKEIQGAATWLKNQSSVEPKKVGVIGFCMGGMLAWQMAIHTPDLAAVAPYYGAGFDPTAEDVARINAPILAVYGEHDGSVPQAQIDKITTMLKDSKKDAEIVVYPGAGHAFLNDKHASYVAGAAEDAWLRAIAFFNGNLKSKDKDAAKA